MKLANSAVVIFSLLLAAHSTVSEAATDETFFAVLVEGTGRYSLPIDTQSEQAQKFFDQGLRLMYGYYIPEAIASHMEALRHDPDNPMIYWALALASGPNPNSRYGKLPDDPRRQAQQAMKRALELKGSANAKQRALIEATRIRFDFDRFPDAEQRDLAYLNAMRRLYEGNPRDPDIGTLYADAYMVMEPWRYWNADATPKPGTVTAAKALETVMKFHPEHPGANHLYIHLIEAGPEPENALPAADRLESLMPIAGHVVHMPSHIYVRVGYYEKAIATNERSIAADEAFLEIWGDHPFPRTGSYFLSATNHRRHAHDFIRYASGVQGNYGRAIASARESLQFVSKASIKRGRGQRPIVTPWIVQKMFGRWDELAAEQPVHVEHPYVNGIWSYVQGSRYVALNDLDQAHTFLKALQEYQRDPESQNIYVRVNSVANLLNIAALGLEGEIKQARGDLAGAIASFEEAVLLQDGLSYIEPPDWPQPMRNYLGAALLETNRIVEAEQVYRDDLAWNRGNGWSLYGLWQSLEAQGRADEAQSVRGQFEQAWRHADVTLTSSRF